MLFLTPLPPSATPHAEILFSCNHSFYLDENKVEKWSYPGAEIDGYLSPCVMAQWVPRSPSILEGVESPFFIFTGFCQNFENRPVEDQISFQIVAGSRGDAQHRSFDKPQHPFSGAPEKNRFHIIGIPFASHDDHLDIVLNRLGVDFHTWDPLADDHFDVVFIHIFFTNRLAKLPFRIDEQFFLDLFFSAQILMNAMPHETAIDDMQDQDFALLKASLEQ
jgi:hypothetical protein